MWKTIEPPEGGHILIGVNQSFLRGESVKMTLIERVWADGFRVADMYYGVRTDLPTTMVVGDYTHCGVEFKNAIRMKVDGPVEVLTAPEVEEPKVEEPKVEEPKVEQPTERSVAPSKPRKNSWCW